LIIDHIDILPCRMPKDDPNWRFALGGNPMSEGWIVAIVSDTGLTGLGYASAMLHMGSTVGRLKSELELFRDKLVGKDPANIEALLVALDALMPEAPAAKAAVDCALHDLLARSLGVPMYQLFGGKMRSSIPVLRILAIKSPEEMAENAQKLVSKGYNYLKIKVHGDVAEDVACVAAIRKRVGPKVHLTIDANQSYSVKNAITALNRMAAYDIDLVEQPVRLDDLKGLKLVTDSVPVTVEADESAWSVKDVFTLVSERIVDAVSLKVPKLGGLRNVMTCARICEVGRIGYRLGATVGTRLLTASAMHLAVALPKMSYACEFGEFDRLLNDPVEGIEIKDGSITVPDLPGAGVRLTEAAKQKTAAE
jgi:L-alanine-DL-glutamate epimerase-like enolase superfamily enzyme